MSEFSVTLQIRAKHAVLLKAAKSFGSVKAFADHLGLEPQEVGDWIRMTRVPSFWRTSRKGKRWRDEAWVRELESKLVAATGQTLDELFPPDVRSEKFLGKSKTREITGSIEMLSLGSDMAATLAIECDEAEQKDSLNHDRNWLSEGLRKLSPKQLAAIKMRFGIECEPHTLSQIAEKLDCHRSNAAVLISAATNKMRDYYRIHGVKFEIFLPPVKGEESKVYGPHAEHWGPVQ